MARFRTTSAFYSDAPGVGKVRAGRTVADTTANAQPGDVILPGLNSQSLPQGFTPLDGTAEVIRAASRWANDPIANVCHGGDSID